MKDDLSHYRFVRFLKEKSEASDCTIQEIKRIQTQLDTKVKVTRTDQGKEFEGLDKYLRDNGIQHQNSCVYTPEQNGRIERENRTIVEAARTMKNGLGLDRRLWAEAVNYANYVINRTGKSSVKDKTPYEVMYNEKPDISNLKTFGTTAFMLIPKEKRKKWDDKSKKGIFVGLDEDIKGYRIYFPEEGKVEVSCNVLFKPGKPVIGKADDFSDELTVEDNNPPTEENKNTVADDDSDSNPEVSDIENESQSESENDSDGDFSDG